MVQGKPKKWYMSLKMMFKRVIAYIKRVKNKEPKRYARKIIFNKKRWDDVWRKKT